MAVYYVLGSILVAWGLGLAIFGLLRPGFPPSGKAGRALIGITVLIVAGTLAALLATTSKEHPREEAAKAAEAKAAAGTATAPAGAAVRTVKVSEKEFSIALAGGTKLQSGKYAFAVANTGTIQHDLSIKGNGISEVKTPLIDAGQSKTLAVDLKPGRYTFYCTVPGHEQSGMKVDVTVAGGAPARAPTPTGAQVPAAAAPVTEKEFSIALAGGTSLKAGNYAFAVHNTGTIQHDLAIQGDGVGNAKTPLIDPGKASTLSVSLKPGTYKFYCTVPGHQQAGMKLAVTVK